MMSEIQLAGFGGQGILFAGKVLAYCGMLADREVSWLPCYGPEMRGGTCNCSVCISDDPIGSPLVLDPDILLVMNTPSYDKFIGNVKAGGKCFIDSSLIEEKCDRSDIECFYVPATELANSNGLKGMANVILLGKVIKETGIASQEVIEKAVHKVVPPKKANLIEANLTALKLGMEQ